MASDLLKLSLSECSVQKLPRLSGYEQLRDLNTREWEAYGHQHIPEQLYHESGLKMERIDARQGMD